MWTLEDALPLIRKISQIALRKGFSVALYGGVLDRGTSEQDLDLFFIEQDPYICNVDGCLTEIAGLPEIHHLGTRHDCTGGELCVIWLADGRHIDAQFRRL
jgi:hypothetical protein